MPSRRIAPALTSLRRSRDFLLLWTGGAASDLGSAVSTLLLPLLAVQSLHATVFQVALIGLASRLPGIVLGLPAGVLVDRIRRRPLMIVCDLLRVLAVASIPVVALFGHVTLWQIYLVTALVSSLRVFFDVADLSYLPTLLTPDQLVDANARLRATETASDSAGPGLGALLAGAVGPPKALAADALSYAISAATLLAIRTPEPARVPSGAKPVTFRAAMGDGLRFIRREPVLRAIAACTATANLGILAVISLEVVYLIRGLHAHPTLVGLILGAGVVGGLAGSLAAPRVARRFGTARAMWLSLVVCSPFALLMPLATPGWGLALYSLGWAVFNFGGAIYQTTQMTYRQAVCPPELLGRIQAAMRWIVWSTMPVGALLSGALGTWIGLRPTLWAATATLAFAGLWLLASKRLRTARDLPASTPTPTPTPIVEPLRLEEAEQD